MAGCFAGVTGAEDDFCSSADSLSRVEGVAGVTVSVVLVVVVSDMITWFGGSSSCTPQVLCKFLHGKLEVVSSTFIHFVDLYISSAAYDLYHCFI